MAAPFLIIDGYNLMHAAGMARRRYGPGGLEKSRNWLLNHLASHLTEAQRGRTTIVFDAGNAPDDLFRQSKQKGMDVVYAPAGGDADTLIEELIEKHSAPRQIRLVSSDHRLQKAARKRRARFVDSEDFASELEEQGPVVEEEQSGLRSHAERGNEGKNEGKYRGATSAAETAAWLEEFGEIPEAAELEQSLDVTSSEMEELKEEVERWEKKLEEPDD